MKGGALKEEVQEGSEQPRIVDSLHLITQARSGRFSLALATAVNVTDEMKIGRDRE
jgi:hypothetical protein